MAFRPGKCLLHNILRENNLTPQEFVERTEYSKQEISDYATSRRKMSLSNAKTIADELGIPIDDLYEWVEVKRKARRQKQSGK
jgi:transcriptional regulator with XRE-family HTH domain